MKKKLVLLAAGLSLVVSMNAQFFTQNILGDLNTHPNDFAAYAISIGTLNRPSAYGSILGLRFWDGGGSDWRTQLAFGTDANFYFRQSTNSAGNSWTSWFNIYHSGNFNRSDVDFTTKNLYANGMLRITSENPQFFLASTNATEPWAAIRGVGGSWLFGYGGISGNEDISIGTQDGSGQRTLTFATGGSAKMKILANGTVGIGTLTPNPLYKLDVAGSIRANEIKVNTTGADFVFEPTYKLRTLAEVETFINQHKHLPDVAPAAEMQTNGVSMGEMQAKLLQKVEELTLYSIEQDKAKVELKQRVEEQDKKLAEQEKELKELKELVMKKLK